MKLLIPCHHQKFPSILKTVLLSDIWKQNQVFLQWQKLNISPKNELYTQLRLSRKAYHTQSTTAMALSTSICILAQNKQKAYSNRGELFLEVLMEVRGNSQWNTKYLIQNTQYTWLVAWDICLIINKTDFLHKNLHSVNR